MQPATSQSEYHVGFVMEQAMGHVTHHRAMLSEAARDAAVRATSMAVPYKAEDFWQRLPGVGGNLSLLLSLRARRAIARQERIAGAFDALFFHTQVTALLSQRVMRRVPTVLSLDATPLNADPMTPAVPSGFARRPDADAPWDRLKLVFNRRAFRCAAALITWSQWARRSLVQDYGIEDERITVIPPGVDLSLWRPRERIDTSVAKPRLLFVGAHFGRKGGDVLLRAFREHLAGAAELDIVSPDGPGAEQTTSELRFHHGLTINSHGLRDLYREADIFVLPTLNDCTPLVVLEAMASGLPVVTTDVGAIREQVEAGATGLLVRPGDPADLAQAVRALIADPERRRAMGVAARARAERHYSAAINYGRVLALLKECVDARRAGEPANALSWHRRTGPEARPPRRGRFNHRPSAGEMGIEAGQNAWVSEH